MRQAPTCEITLTAEWLADKIANKRNASSTADDCGYKNSIHAQINICLKLFPTVKWVATGNELEQECALKDNVPFGRCYVRSGWCEVTTVGRNSICHNYVQHARNNRRRLFRFLLIRGLSRQGEN